MKIRSQLPKPVLISVILILIVISLLLLLLLVASSTFPVVSDSGNESSEYLKSRTNTRTMGGPDESYWTRITDGLYIYSAYLDKRPGTGNGAIVRVVGIWKIPRATLKQNPLKWVHLKDESYFGEEYRGVVFYEEENSSSTTTGQLLNISCSRLFTRQVFEEGLKIYAGVFIKCGTLLPFENLNIASMYIAIYPKEVPNYPTKLIPVAQFNSNLRGSQHFLSICVRPLFGPFNSLHKLAQFIAYYETMGVTSFTFYDLAVTGRVRQYLRSVHVHLLHPWNLPTGTWSELWDYGTLAALNDCLLRNMYTSKYVLVVDVDEFVVPHAHDSILEALQELESTPHGNCSQFLIRNTFFCSEFCPKEQAEEFGAFNSCNLRTRKVWKAESRSKYIVKPTQIEQLGHHWVTRFIGEGADKRMAPRNQTRTFEFSPSDMLLNHYRSCASISNKKQPILNAALVYDDRIMYFEHKMKNTTNFKVYKVQRQ